MKRAPTWLALTGVGVVLTALCLCDWIMGWWTELPESVDPIPAPAAPAPPSRAADSSQVVPAPAPAPLAQAVAPEPVTQAPALAPVVPPPVPVASMSAPAAPAPPPTPAVQARSAEPMPIPTATVSPGPIFTAPPRDVPQPTRPPQFVAPPGAIPGYLLESAERTTQLVRGFTRGEWIVFGFYPDGIIRLVDLDGGRYEGHANAASAKMCEAGGSRSFALAIGVAADGRLQATFSGGIHDGQTIVLETIAEKPVA